MNTLWDSQEQVGIASRLKCTGRKMYSTPFFTQGEIYGRCFILLSVASLSANSFHTSLFGIPCGAAKGKIGAKLRKIFRNSHN